LQWNHKAWTRFQSRSEARAYGKKILNFALADASQCFSEPFHADERQKFIHRCPPLESGGQIRQR
jgi:hypothetical protein